MDKIFEALSNNGFATADYLVFAVYIVILVGMGLFLSRTKKGEEKSSTDYFLAGNTLTWWAVLVCQVPPMHQVLHRLLTS